MSTSTSTTAFAADPAPDGYYTTAELRKRWCCGRSKVYALIETAAFPEPVVIGRTLLFPKHEVWAWEQSEEASDAA